MNLNALSSFALRATPVALLATAAAVYGAATPAISPEQRDFFENKIRPIFANSCMECHSEEKGKTKGSFNMDSRESTLKGGETGPSMKPGDAKNSLLIKAVTWEDDLQMPPKKKLSDEEIEDLKKWVAMGAPDPREPSKGVKNKKSHWAFQPVTRPELPTVKNPGWCVNSIDKFVLSKLETKSMLPASPADREALLRRAYFDLIGLPPSPKQIEAFVRDPNPDQAYARIVDQLLADPGYGERWARHWLDTARYSDTTGVTGNARFEDYRYAYAYSYRDWVIGSINSDMPYDQFILNQLAADKIPDNKKENLAAMGFLTVGQRFGQKDEIINDRIDVIGRGFLGLTIACARCHDHKFDPVTAADYYALRGVFDSITEPKEGPLISGDPNSTAYLEFNKKLTDLENKAYESFFSIQREVSDRVRKNAEDLFKIAYLSRRDATPEEKKEATDLLEKSKIQARFVDDTTRINDNNPVTGMFSKMITLKDNRDKLLSMILEGKSKGPKYNQEVIDFLKKQPQPFPSDLPKVAALYGKMMLDFEPKVAQLYTELRDPSKKTAESTSKAALELATFPLPMVGRSDLDMDKLREQGKRWGLNFGGQLEGRAGLAKINELKLTFKGGPVRAMVVEDLPKPKDSPIFVRGNPPKADEKPRIVPRQFIEVLSADGKPTPFKQGSGRLELAQAIASKTNPLTARVLVNRVWMYHFGEGLVRTPDDLGNQAGDPSHPELLDFLSSWFVEDYGPAKPAWSVKALHKAIMLSKTYQQSSNTSFRNSVVDYQKLDPANTTLWHSNVRRLDFESFRDSLLTMAGMLDRTMNGPAVNITEEPYSFRRSVYGYIDRANMPDLLMQFDMSNPDQPNTKRTSTIVPQQALFLMNSAFVANIVQRIVARPEVIQAVSVEKSTDAGISAIFRIVLQRLPTPAERQLATRFLVEEAKQQQGVRAETADINKEAAKRAESRIKGQQNNNGARKAILNDFELAGNEVTLAKSGNTVSNVTNASEMRVGWTVSGTGIPADTVITAINGNTLTLSKKATVAAKDAKLRAADIVQRVTFSPWETLVQAILFSNEAAYVN
jgi:cytochrome c553